MVHRNHLIVGTLVAMSAVYVLIYSYLEPKVLVSLIHTKFKWLKSADEGTHEKSVTRGSTRNLVDLQKTMLLKESINDPPAKGMNSTLDILVYDFPVWFNLSQQSIFLQTHCFYNNCRMSNNKTNIKNADAIIFFLINIMDDTPPVSRNERNPNQPWIFFYLESPVHHYKKQYRHKNWRNTMNWSLSYQMDSDIFYPYGYLETRSDVINKNYSTIFHRKSKLAVWAVSRCRAQSKRDKFVSELVSHGVQVDVFGECSNKPILNHTELKAVINKDYKFYLSFENSFCTDYVTEKFFRYFNYDVVLIVRGGFDYDKYLPNGTFINTSKFTSIKNLANYIIEVGNSEELYTKILRNKDKYVGHSHSPMYSCRMCEKLNNLDASRKTFEDHATYVHKNRCWSPSDIPFTKKKTNKGV